MIFLRNISGSLIDLGVSVFWFHGYSIYLTAPSNKGVMH